MSRLLIVDDDVEVLALLKKFFVQQGYQVSVATDGVGLWAALEREVPDLIILDLMLPGDNGLTLCQRLRLQHATPVIMLTAMGELSDRVVGLEMGADDYLGKPFDARELLARVRAVLRRSGESRPLASEVPRPLIRFADWQLDLTRRELRSPDQVMIPLSAGSSTCCWCSSSTRSASSPASNCSTWPGARPMTPSIAASMSRSAACGASWSSIPSARR